MMNRSTSRLPGTFLITCLALATIVRAEDTAPSVAASEGAPPTDSTRLRDLIDSRMATTGGPAPARCGDGEYLRRVWLDLAGMPPTADEARAFLADTTENKREQLVDRLLSSPWHARHLAATLDLMLMERRGYKHVTADEWQAWLLKSVRENKPWNVLARELLSASGDEAEGRPAVRFALDRDCDSHLMTRDVGRIFFGRDMQCAQCHDHPLIDDYLQSDYHGLLAFVSPGYAVASKQGDKQVTLHAERAGADVAFESVFDKGTPRRTGARMPGDVVIEEPYFLPGEEYRVAPADNVKSVPKFSRRDRLAQAATDGANQAFNRNIANRLWAHMLGRGLVQPLDLHHSGNPATHPELLRLLGERFAAMNFDMRRFLREIALTETYQRSFDPPEDLTGLPARAADHVAEWESGRPALKEAVGESVRAYSEALDAWIEAEAATLPVAGELDAARGRYTEANKKVEAARKEESDATAQRQAKQALLDTIGPAAGAAEAAAKALPDDKELAEAAGKFVARSKALTDEIAALEKVVSEKSAAWKAASEALASPRSEIEQLVAKKAPLDGLLRDAERTLLETRQRVTRDSLALAALDRRLKTGRQIAELPNIRRSLDDALGRLSAPRSGLETARRTLAEQATEVARREAEVESATDSLAAAEGALAAARTDHEERAELVKLIGAAVGAVEQARGKAGDDSVLTEVATRLKERAAAAAAETGQARGRIESAVAAVESARQVVESAKKVRDGATAEQAVARQAVDAAVGSLAAAEAECAARQADWEAAQSALTDDWARDFTVASLKPLTPEQLCWSLLRVTGVYDRQWEAERAELEKSAPLSDQERGDPARMAERAFEIEQRTFDKLKGNVGTFVSYYGAAAGQPQGDFFSTADQALFVVNGGTVNGWIAPSGDNVTQRVVAAGSDPRTAAEQLYLGLLTRLPTPEEVDDVARHLSGRDDDRPAAAQELVWGLLNSAEFRFNH